MEDGTRPELGDADAGDEPGIALGMEPAHRLIALLIDALGDREEAMKVIHLHMRTGHAAARDRAAIAGGDARDNREAEIAGRRDGAARHREDNLDGRGLALDLREALLDAAHNRRDHTGL